MLKASVLKVLLYVSSILIMFIFVYRFISSSSFILNPSARFFISKIQFTQGTCLISKQYWSVNPKKVIGTKFKKGEVLYLLRDVDRYEHSYYFVAKDVEKIAIQTNCR